jgi:tellurite methyltransferase
MNKSYWEKFYKTSKRLPPSSFAEFCLPYIKGKLTELGCGNGRDLLYFLYNNIESYGVDEAFESQFIEKQSIRDYIKTHKSNPYIYTRFFWHAISREDQLAILKWIDKYIFIEARTTKDKERYKIYKGHERNYINTEQLRNDLKKNKFKILFFKEGTGMSLYKDENPHLVRVIAKKLR